LLREFDIYNASSGYKEMISPTLNEISPKFLELPFMDCISYQAEETQIMMSVMSEKVHVKTS